MSPFFCLTFCLTLILCCKHFFKSTCSSTTVCTDRDYRAIIWMWALCWHFTVTAWLCRIWVGVSCCEALEVVASSTMKVRCVQLPFISLFLASFSPNGCPILQSLMGDLSYNLDDNEALFTQTNTPLCVRRQWDLAQAALWPHHSWPGKVSGFTQSAQLADD